MDDLPRRELFDEELYLHTFPESRSPCAMAILIGLRTIGHGVAGSSSLAASAWPDQHSCWLRSATVSRASGASDGLANDDPLVKLTVGGTSLVVAESDSAQKQHAGCKPVKRPRRGGQSGNAEAGYLVGDELRVKPRPTHRDAKLTRNLGI